MQVRERRGELCLAQVGDISTLHIWVIFQLGVYKAIRSIDSNDPLGYCAATV